MTENPAKWLRDNQHQLDADGVMVGVSRQALDETLDALETLTAENERLRGALTKAGWQFLFYAAQHLNKGTDEGREKAKTNQDMADMCTAALSPSKEPDHG